MANLQLCDKHNMVAFLKRPKNSEGFHKIVDFLNRSTLRYALITNPTIYTSQIKQFWQTATIKTLDSGEVEIKATVDGHDKTITEAYVRSSLQLADADGISNMSTTEIFEQLTLMGGIIHKTPTRLNDAPLLGVNTPGSAEGSLSQTELTDLRVKSVKDQLKTEKSKYTRRKFQIVISEDEADLLAEDSSKQGRIIEDIDLDVDTSLVQPHVTKDFHFGTPTKISKSDTVPKTVSEVQTYTRRRRDVNDVNTGSEAVNIASQREGKVIMEVNEILKKFKKGEYKQISHDEEVAQKLYAEELAKDTARQAQEKNDLEKALELQKYDPAMLRYHALPNRSFSIAEVKKNKCTYLKNQGGYKQSHFKGMSYEDIRPIFESVWDQNHAFIPKDSDIEKEQPAGEEKEKKKDKESSKQVEEVIVQQEDVVAKQVVKESYKKAGVRLKRKVAKARDDKDKRQKMQDDPEKLTLIEYVKVIYDSEEINSVIPLAVKSLIVNWKSYCKGDVGYYEIHRADGSYKTYIYFSEMLNDFDREDLIILSRLFNEKYASTRPDSAYTLVYTHKVSTISYSGFIQGNLTLDKLRIDQGLGSISGIRACALRNFDLEVMEFEFAQSNTTAKLPILKLGEYEMWVIRIKQYFQVQDYALWEVIKNGNSWVSVPQTTQENISSVTKMSVPITVEEKTNKKNDVKARSLLLMALPNEHQLTFN
ncbi:hypothetical protein Tco_1404449 [Tanacetum coccineum]